MPVQKPNRPAGKKAEKSEAWEPDICCRHHGRSNLFWGVVMIVLGFYWLANSLGWLKHVDVPLFPLVIIVLGVYMIIRGQSRGNASKQDDSKS